MLKPQWYPHRLLPHKYLSYFIHNKTATKWNWLLTFILCWRCECMQLQAPYMSSFLSPERASLLPLAFQTICSETSSLTMCELLYMCANYEVTYSYKRCLIHTEVSEFLYLQWWMAAEVVADWQAQGPGAFSWHCDSRSHKPEPGSALLAPR
jgi:hypothetical protein